MTRTPSENPGETAIPVGGGAKCGARWGEIRELVAACVDLPETIRQQLVKLGDMELIALQSTSPT